MTFFDVSDEYQGSDSIILVLALLQNLAPAIAVSGLANVFSVLCSVFFMQQTCSKVCLLVSTSHYVSPIYLSLFFLFLFFSNQASGLRRADFTSIGYE